MWIEWSEEQAVAGVVPQISRLVLEVGDIFWLVSKLSFLQLDDLDSHVGILPLCSSRFGQNIPIFIYLLGGQKDLEVLEVASGND